MQEELFTFQVVVSTGWSTDCFRHRSLSAAVGTSWSSVQLLIVLDAEVSELIVLDAEVSELIVLDAEVSELLLAPADLLFHCWLF